MMSDKRDIPIELKQLTEWLEHYFGRLDVDERTRADIDRVFDGIVHRGNLRQLWFDVLWLKVQELRATDMPLHNAARTALHTWTADDPPLPRIWSDPDWEIKSAHSFPNLIQRLKNRIEDVSDLKVYKVTDSHFWLALVAGRFVVAARLYRAANSDLKPQLRDQLVEMASRIAP
jgi:hypothetical protein